MADSSEDAGLLLEGAAEKRSQAIEPKDVPVYNAGGWIMNGGKIVPVFWGSVSQTVSSAVPGFYAALEHTGLYDGLHEYATGGMDPMTRFTTVAPIAITPSNRKTQITRDEIATELANQIQAGVLPHDELSQRMVFAVHLPPGVNSDGTCSSNCGYHSELYWSQGSTSWPFIVVPDLEQAGCTCPVSLGTGTTAFDYYTLAISHELMEAKTNPFPFTRPAWAPEIADPCAGKSQRFSSQIAPYAKYYVQQLYSLVAGKCVGWGPISPLQFDRFGFDNQLGSSTEFAKGQSKAECSTAGVVTGFSKQAGSPTHPSRVLCREDLPTPLHASDAFWSVRDLDLGTDRGDRRISWALGYDKAECGAEEAVLGMSQNSSGIVSKILCRHVTSHPNPTACTEVRFSTTGNFTYGDWDVPPPNFVPNPKVECPADSYVKGVSRSSTTKELHSALCCKTSPKQVHGDADGDGKADLIFPGALSTALPVAYSAGDGFFDKTTSKTLTPFSAWAQSAGVKVAPGDFDGDGHADVALLGGPGWNDVAVGFGQGDGRFNVTDFVNKSFGVWATGAGVQVVPGDFNGDGLDDLMLVGGQGWTDIPYAYSTGDGHFTVVDPQPPNFPGWAATAGAHAVPGDFDGNGFADVALTGVPGWKDIPVALNKGDGTFRIVDVTQTVPGSFGDWASAANVRILPGDFDGDGRSDIAIIGGTGWTDIPIAHSIAAGVFELWDINSPVLANVAQDPTEKILTGDYDGDGKTDIALFGRDSSSNIIIAFSRGDGSFTVQEKLATDVATWSKKPNTQARSGF